jgi:hypothetical protein
MVEPIAIEQPQSPKSRVLFSVRFFARICALVLGLLQAREHCFELNMDDSISYLEIAHFYLQGNWSMALNAYWSPLYSWLLAGALALLHPDSYYYLTIFKVVNFASLLLSMLGFEFLLNEFLTHLAALRRSESPSLTFIEGLAYLMFIVTGIGIGGVWRDTPDLLATAFIYGGTGLLLRLAKNQASQNPDNNFKLALALGLCLGIGYLAKAVILTFTPLFFALAYWPFKSRKHRQGLLVSFLALLVSAGTFILAISLKERQPVISQAGTLNYAWFVSRSIPFSHALYVPEKNQIHPWKHPSNVIMENPQCFYFEKPFATTLPTHYSPAYFFEGYKLHFDLQKQIWAGFAGLVFYGQLFFLPLLLSWFLQSLICWNWGINLSCLKQQYLVLAPALWGLGVYALGMNMYTPFTARYVTSFLCLFYLAWLGALKLPPGKRSSIALSISTFTLLSFLVPPLLADNKFCPTNITRKNENHAYLKAQWLKAKGLEPGDKIVMVGPPRKVAWAQIAHLRIVGDIPERDLYFEKQNSYTPKLTEILKRKGIKALICSKDTNKLGQSWLKLEPEDFALFLLK